MKIFKRILGFTSAVLLTVALAFPQIAYATETTVEITNRGTSAANKIKVSSLVVDGLEAPVKGKALDPSATVNTKEGYSWEIPAIWLDAKGGMCSGTAKGTDYRPVLVFYIPEEYEAVTTDGKFDVQISDAIKALIGTDGLQIVAGDNVGINFILDASTFAPFAMAVEASRSTQIPTPASVSSGSGSGNSGSSDGNSNQKERTLLDMFCANTAREAIDEESLYDFVYRIIYDLIPQAVQILESNFPGFAEAAKSGELGNQIGLYVYHKNGDKDGIETHESADNNVLAFVACNIWKENEEDYFGYYVGVNTYSVILKDEDGNAVLSDSGKYLLKERDTELENTILHEMVHALMDDYNRVGSTGSMSPEEWYDETDEGYAKYYATALPKWFKEGLATSVENGYQERNYYMNLYRYKYELEDEVDSNGNYLRNGNYVDEYSEDILINAYINRFFRFEEDGEYITDECWLDLDDSGKEDDPDKARDTGATYASGYLAILYLGELAAVKDGVGSSIMTDSDGEFLCVDSGTIKYGVNLILERLHSGETLDSVIYDISNGEYESTNDFQSEFIKGEEVEQQFSDGEKYKDWGGDEGSIDFCVTYLNYMLSVEQETGKTPNGSILLEFDDTSETMMEPGTYPEVNEFIVVDCNTYTTSSVDRWEDGGKSRSRSLETEPELEEIDPADYIDKGQIAASASKAARAEEAAEVADSTLEVETTELAETIETTGTQENVETSEITETSEMTETEKTDTEDED